jgi:hypothetical protein
VSRYEYRLVTLPDSDTKEEREESLNRLGQDGWYPAVFMSTRVRTDVHYMDYAVFMRVTPSENGENK